MRRYHLGQHVLRQYQHHWPRATAHGCGVCPLYILRYSQGVVYTLHKLGHWAKKLGKVHLLKRFTVPAVSSHIAHQQQQRCAVLKRGVQANARIGRTWPPCDHADTRAPRQLAMRFSHECRPTLLATRYKLNGFGMEMQTIKNC